MNNFVFFGTSRFSVIILDDLKNKFGIVPDLIVTLTDKPKGRKQIITPPETKIWADKNDVPTFQPPKLKDPEVSKKLQGFEFYMVASYGKIIPQSILDLPKRGTLNIHPSLLPKYRGPSPIQFQILSGEKKIGTTVMLIDKEMDHGPVLLQKEISFDDPFIGTYEETEEKLAHESAELMAEALPKWLLGNLSPAEQEHQLATFTSMIKKEDGEIKLDADPAENYRKYLAYHHWPKVYFYSDPPAPGGRVGTDGPKRNIITEATFENGPPRVDESPRVEAGQFKIIKIIPEGKKEMLYISSI